MRIILSLLCLFTIAQVSLAQFAIGTRTITYNDPARTGGFGSGGGPGRQIQCEVYYPSTTSGTNTAVADGQFPIIVFGHGFAMSWDAYQNIWQHLVPQGYIIIFPRTEGGLFPAPSHNDFGLDLALVSERLLEENNNSSSSFYQKINGNSAIMGHSMGGGATILAAQNNSNIKTIIGLAPAETNPSAIAAAVNGTVPTLILSGSSDGVTPPAEHHIPIYEVLSSSCKSFVSITGGAHCYFANTNFNCDFGEGASSSNISITRNQQQAYMNSLVTPWLDFYLKGECSGYTEFQTAAAANGLVLTQSCAYTPMLISTTIIDAINGESNGSASVEITGGSGSISYLWSNGSETSSIINVLPGTYTLTYSDEFCSQTVEIEIGDNIDISGIDKQLNALISLHPNPNNGIISLSSPFDALHSIEIFDALGQLVYALKNASIRNLSIDVSELSPGIYNMKISNQENWVVKRFVKE